MAEREQPTDFPKGAQDPPWADIAEQVLGQVVMKAKPWWQSKTVYGGIGGVMTGLFGVYYWLTGPEKDTETLSASISAIVFGALAIYGRFKATTTVTAGQPPAEQEANIDLAGLLDLLNRSK